MACHLGSIHNKDCHFNGLADIEQRANFKEQKKVQTLDWCSATGKYLFRYSDVSYYQGPR